MIRIPLKIARGGWRPLRLGLFLNALLSARLLAQTDGGAKLQATLLDYNGSSTKHWTVVWVSTSSGTFIKSLWKQGPSITATHWNNHCGTWYAAKNGSTALDGYSSATAANYSGTNSPVILTWNCRDTNNNLVADGAYKFWIQYAEDNGQGPFTTGGLLWNKGANGATNTYNNQGANFANMRVTWTPAPPPTVAPSITSDPPTNNGTVGVYYSFTCAATGTSPVGFLASGLPDGLSMSPTGVISGVPTLPGVFNGTLTATNGTLPNGTQPFSLTIIAVPANISSTKATGNQLLLAGTGPANGTYAVLFSTNLPPETAQWSPIHTNSFDGLGSFGFTNDLDLTVPQGFYRLRVP